MKSIKIESTGNIKVMRTEMKLVLKQQKFEMQEEVVHVGSVSEKYVRQLLEYNDLIESDFIKDYGYSIKLGNGHMFFRTIEM